MRNLTPDRVVGVLALVLAVTAPFYLSGYWIGALLTQMLFLGIVAASVIFLSAYGGMVSLAQVSMYGIAGFVLGNATTNGNTKGLNLGWSPWIGIVLGIVIAVAIGLLFGALLLGMTSNFSAAYLPADYTYYSIIFTFVLVAVVLAVRPLGLFGRPA